jgi:hypothetical protein
VHLAEKSLFIVISRIVWGFDISKKIGPDGAVIEPKTRMMDGFLSVPEPFDVDIKCRSPAHKKIIRDVYETSQAEGLNYRS